MIGKEGAKFVRTISQRQEDVRDEARLLLHRKDPGADILRQSVDGGRLKSLGGELLMERFRLMAARRRCRAIYRFAAKWIPLRAKNPREDFRS